MNLCSFSESLITTGPVILGSRSPRRRELLSSVVGHNQLIILPPSSPEEAGFAGLTSDSDIEQRLLEVAGSKHQDVVQQAEALIDTQPDLENALRVVGDTIVIATEASGSRIVLGQPAPENWQHEVRHWLIHLLGGKSHDVWTAVCVSRGEQLVQQIVRSKVTFCPITPDLAEWYIRTGESVGKAGGYAIQGFGAVLVERLEGSLTNVIGLPLREVMELLSMFQDP